MALMRNKTSAVVRFRIAGMPGQEPTFYVVEPGETCEVPDGYAHSGLIARIAPGLEPAKASSEKPIQPSSRVEPAPEPVLVSDDEKPEPSIKPKRRTRRKG